MLLLFGEREREREESTRYHRGGGGGMREQVKQVWKQHFNLQKIFVRLNLSKIILVFNKGDVRPGR